MPWAAWLCLLFALVLPLAALFFIAAKAWHVWARRKGRVSGGPALAERRSVWIPSAVYATGYAVCLLYAWQIEPAWVEVTHTELPVTMPVLGHERFRIVHLSDLHLEGVGRRERAVLDAVRRLQPHLIVLTGDYLNDRRSQNDLVNFLKALEAPHGVYAVGGNWDGKWPIADLVASAGHRFLHDDYQLLRRAGRDLLLVGQDFHATRSLEELLDGAADEPFRLFLHHSPDAVDQLGRARVDLFLCGHTHGGQVRLPLYGAIVTMSREGKRYEQGLYRLAPPLTANPDGTPMYVNRGIGMVGIGPRLRFLARPEVAVIDLVAR